MDLLNLDLAKKQRAVLRVNKKMTLWYGLYQTKLTIAPNKTIDIDLFEPRDAIEGSLILVDGLLNPMGLLGKSQHRMAPVRAFNLALSRGQVQLVETGEYHARAVRVLPFQQMMMEKLVTHQVGRECILEDGCLEVKPSKIPADQFIRMRESVDVIQSAASPTEWRLARPLAEMSIPAP